MKIFTVNKTIYRYLPLMEKCIVNNFLFAVNKSHEYHGKLLTVNKIIYL